VTVGETPRVLLAITVYNGRAFVPKCIESAARLRGRAEYDLDVLVLDDASPEPGFSDDLLRWCRDAGIDCYRTPRNLGIVRNVNLGLLRAMDGDYDFVIIANSDVVFPSNLITGMIAIAESDETIGSVTAWSTNVSAYSLPNVDPDAYIDEQVVVDWLSASLEGEFGHGAMDVPAGISFCILIPRRVVHDVGIMDPVFGRGYCEETDWSLRSRARGWRVVLAPGVFVYHAGRGSTVEAGLVAGGHSTVPENEAVIDLRYPLFRGQVHAFLASELLPTARRNASRRIIADAARQFGWELDLSWLRPVTGNQHGVRCSCEPSGRQPMVRASFRGFECEVPIEETDIPGSLLSFFGSEPSFIGVAERGDVSDRLFAEWGEGVDNYRYPHHV
jgi:GT2 family glycosyltransferase